MTPPMQAPVHEKRGLKRRVHAILETAEEGDRLSHAFDVFLMVFISVNVASVVLETVPSLWSSYRAHFQLFELISVVIFTAEYVLRVWSCTEDPRFRHPLLGRLRFMVTPMAIVDLLAVLPFYLPMALTLDMRIIRILRLFRLLRMLKLVRYSESLTALRDVVRSRRGELTMALAFAGAILLVAASVLYFVEHEAQPEVFSSIPAAMWWGIATLTTVGYGDIYPVTSLGRLFGAVVAVVGVGLFALPAGILASGLSEHMEKARLKQAQEHEQAQAQARCPHCGKTLHE
jgi:voltage-gated potassium channel